MKKRYKKFGIIFFSVYMLLIIVGCSPIKRHPRLVKKFPHVHTQDTIVQRDTIRVEIPSVQVDTIYQIDSFQVALYDTIIVEQERLKIKMYAVHDSVFIEGKCDTIFVDKIIERKIPIRYYKEKDPDLWKTWAKWGGLSLLLLIVLFIIYRILKLFV